jgi:hypothetical protein
MTENGRRGFFCLPNAAVDEWLPKVGPLAFAAYCVLTRMANGQGECFPGYDAIAEKMGCSRRNAIRAVKTLVGAGLVVTTERKTEKGTQQSNVFTLPQAPKPGDSFVTRLGTKPGDRSDTNRVTNPVRPGDKSGQNRVTALSPITRPKEEDPLKKTEGSVSEAPATANPHQEAAAAFIREHGRFFDDLFGPLAPGALTPFLDLLAWRHERGLPPPGAEWLNSAAADARQFQRGSTVSVGAFVQGLKKTEPPAPEPPPPPRVKTKSELEMEAYYARPEAERKAEQAEACRVFRETYARVLAEQQAAAAAGAAN